jgi:hypothetical protein
MKASLLAVLMIFLVACKSETPPAKINTLNDNQIVISGNMLNSTGVQEFAREIERRQKENPDKIFEVVKNDKSLSTSKIILSHFTDDVLYPNKNFYIFIGLGSGSKNEGIQKTDWDAIYYIMNYAAGLQYRVLINVNATTEHLRIASEDDDTAVILWSSHGNTDGFYDYNGEMVPYDVFHNKSKNFYQLVLSSCEGRIALNNHYETPGLVTWAWEGLTTSEDMKKFLVSDAWSIEDGKILSTPVDGITCTASGKNFSLMNVEDHFKIGSPKYTSLKECNEALKSTN